MLAAQLNELGVSQGPEAPPRPNRQHKAPSSTSNSGQLMLFCLISSFITLQHVASNRRLRIAIATHTTHSFVRHYDHHFYSRCCRPEFSPFRPSADPSSTSSHNAQNSHLEGKPKGRTSNN